MVYPLTAITRAIQGAKNSTPRIIIEFEGGAKLDTNDPRDGLLKVELTDEFLSSRGTIVATPKSHSEWIHPNILPAFTGLKVTITIGFIGTTQSIRLTPLYVGSVFSSSLPGEITITFNLISWWELLAGGAVILDPATSGSPVVWPGDTTIQGILGELLSGRAPVRLDNSDGIVPIYKPYYEVDDFESVLTTVRNLMDMTRSYIKLRADGFHILYPRSIDPVTQLYSLDGYAFQSKSLTARLVIPNRIWVVPLQASADLAPAFEGVATDTNSVNKVGAINMIVVDEGIKTAGEANTRAEVLLDRIRQSSSAGSLEVGVHIGQELFDAIDIKDDRTGALIERVRIGKITRVWSPGNFAMELGLGGLAPHLGGVQTYPDVAPYLPPPGLVDPITGTPIGPFPDIEPVSESPPITLEPPVRFPPGSASRTLPPVLAAVWTESPARAIISPQIDAYSGRSYAPVLGTPGSVTGRRHRETWYISGNIGTDTALGPVPRISGGRWRLIEVTARVKTAPVGSSITIDIEYQLVVGGAWLSIFVSSLFRLAIAAGAIEAVFGTIKAGLILPPKTLLRLNTSSTANPLGIDLTVELDSSIRVAGQ